MKSYHKHIVITALSALIVFFSFTSCSDDIVLPPLETLLGDYSGRFIVKTDLSVGGVVRIDQAIQWRFTDIAYILIDTSKTICVPSGTYELTGEVKLIPADGPAGLGQQNICNPNFNPVGVFSLRQPDDSVILIQQLNDTLRELRLIRN